MQLYFIRHAQSENNAHWGQADFQEKSDPELTEIGFEQADQLAKFLGKQQRMLKQGTNEIEWNNKNQFGFGLTHLYTSLMVRAVATATVISQHTGLPLVAWPEIHETGGIFSRLPDDERKGLPGKDRAYFEVHYPDLQLPEWLDHKGWWNNRPFEDEDEEMPKARAESVWQDLLARHGDRPGRPEQRVAIISHGGFFMYLFTSALKLEMRRLGAFKHEYWFIMNNCAITRLDVQDGRVLVAYANRTDFLPPELIT